MNAKKIMLIINPCAGRKAGKKKAGKVEELFRSSGAECDVFMTAKRNDATQFVIDSGAGYDVIACMGGDGTLNEVINGMLKADLDLPLGYIPAGSTNDFARSMHLSKKLSTAVKNILDGAEKRIDAGLFNDRYFGYVASFGIFTRTSYSTPQRVKNIFGGKLSYIIHGLFELGRVRCERMKVEVDGRVYEGKYLFGAVTNSTSLGGVLKYDPKLVDMSDQQLEMMLIPKPKNPARLFRVLRALLSKKITDNPDIIFTRSDRFFVQPSARSDWSLDGEFAYTAGSCEIRCIKNRIRFICPDGTKPQ